MLTVADEAKRMSADEHARRAAEAERQHAIDEMERTAARLAVELGPGPAAELLEEMACRLAPRERTSQRAGITTNKGHGEGKARRKLAAESRRRNRRA